MGHDTDTMSADGTASEPEGTQEERAQRIGEILNDMDWENESDDDDSADEWNNDDRDEESLPLVRVSSDQGGSKPSIP